MGRKIILAFDLYGTIISTSSISTTLSDVLSLEPAKGNALASRWRTLQLEYSWRITCMSKYVSFRELTRASLLHTLAEDGIPEPDDDTISKLMGAYDGLRPFWDAVTGLDALGTEKESTEHEIKAYVFSNGAEITVRHAIDKAGLEARTMKFDGVVSVQPKNAFKPSLGVYRHMIESTGGGQDAEVWLISCNPFDIVGALGSGISNLKAAWVDRSATGWIDRLGSVIGVDRPSLIANGVDEAIGMIINGNK